MKENLYDLLQGHLIFDENFSGFLETLASALAEMPTDDIFWKEWDFYYGDYINIHLLSDTAWSGFLKQFFPYKNFLKDFKYILAAIQTMYELFVILVTFFFLNEVGVVKEEDCSGGAVSWYQFLEALVSGRVYERNNIVHFTDHTMFSWYLDYWNDEIETQLEVFVKKIKRFVKDTFHVIWNLLPADLFKTLYETVFPQQIRHLLGEYYTPSWLAEDIVTESLEYYNGSLAETRFLDPACGSGTFLIMLFKFIKEKVGETRFTAELLEKLLLSIVGFDFNPLAVLTARANYVINLAKFSKEIFCRRRIFLPIYHVDSLGLYHNLVEPTNSKSEKKRKKVLEIDFIDNIKVKAPLDGESEVWFENVSEEIRVLTGSKGAKKRETQRFYNYINDIRYYWKMDKFDVVVGNPPWLTLSNITHFTHQNKLKRLIMEEYQLTRRAELVPHLEIATLQFVHSIKHFLKVGGIIAFVLPRSILAGNQHHNFRMNQIRGCHYTFLKILDLEKVPQIFNTQSVVVIASKMANEATSSQQKKKDISVRQLPAVIYLSPETVPSKKLQEREWLKNTIKRVVTTIYLIQRPTRSLFTYQKVDGQSVHLTSTPSPYRQVFKQGPTLVPRVFWFVTVTKENGGKKSVKSQNEKIYSIKTSLRAYKNAKKPWKIRLPPKKSHEIITSEVLYGVITSTDLLPFHPLSPVPAVLPVKSTEDGKFALYRPKILKNWLKHCEMYWNQYKTKRNAKVTLYEWINYRDKLIKIPSTAEFFVVYPSVGTHLVATLYEVSKWQTIYDFESDTELPIKGLIPESSVYYFVPTTENEAFYLVAILNSPYLNTLLKDLQPRGLWGPRSIHTKPLDFPIPLYDETNDVHKKIVELGRLCYKKAAKIAQNNIQKKKWNLPLTQYTVGTYRNDLRRRLSAELEQISVYLKELFTQHQKEG